MISHAVRLNKIVRVLRMLGCEAKVQWVSL